MKSEIVENKLLLSRIIIISLILFFFLLYSWIEIKRFYLGLYGFHDLGLNSDFLSNTAKGNFFYISDYSINHLSINFSPSIVLVTFLFRIFESQLVTVMLAVSSICLSSIPIYLISKKYFHSKRISLKLSGYFQFLIIILYYNNIYTYFALSSGTYVTSFTLISLIYLYSLFKSPNSYISLILLFLLLGLRQDSALYTVCNIASIFLLKGSSSWNKKELQFISAHLIISIVYAVSISLYIQPLFGSEALEYPNRFWSKYGDTWPQVFTNYLINPRIVILDYLQSGFLKWNQSFGYFQIFSPVMFLLNSASGILFFTANSIDRNHLLLYNSSFLLPGMIIAVIASLYYMYQMYNVSKIMKFLTITIALFFLIVATFEIKKYYKIQLEYNKTVFENIFKIEYSDSYILSKKLFSEYPEISSIAADFNSYIFLPNSKEKYLLHNRDKVDAILIQKNFSNILSGDLQNDNFRQLLKEENWYILYETQKAIVFIKNDLIHN